MTRKFLTTASTIAALMAVPALAQSEKFEYDTKSPRMSNEYVEYDSNQIAMSQSAFRALSNARGDNMETTDGTVIGMIENVNVSEQGNPELVVELTDDQAEKFDTDVLVITVTPGNVMMSGDKLALATTLDELILASQAGTEGSYADRKSVTLP